MHSGFAERFAAHALKTREVLRQRQEASSLECVALDRKRLRAGEHCYGLRGADDRFAGDVALRDMQQILRTFDAKGYEREGRVVPPPACAAGCACGARFKLVTLR